MQTKNCKHHNVRAGIQLFHMGQTLKSQNQCIMNKFNKQHAIFHIKKQKTERNRKIKRVRVRGLLFKLMVHIIETTDHSVLGLIYTAGYFTLIYGHYLHRIYEPLAV